MKNRYKIIDRWSLYEALKGNRPIDDNMIQDVETMDIVELREGTLEFLLMKKRYMQNSEFIAFNKNRGGVSNAANNSRQA